MGKHRAPTKLQMISSSNLLPSRETADKVARFVGKVAACAGVAGIAASVGFGVAKTYNTLSKPAPAVAFEVAASGESLVNVSQQANTIVNRFGLDTKELAVGAYTVIVAGAGGITMAAYRQQRRRSSELSDSTLMEAILGPHDPLDALLSGDPAVEAAYGFGDEWPTGLDVVIDRQPALVGAPA